MLLQNCFWRPNLSGGNSAQLFGGFWILFGCIYVLLGSSKAAGPQEASAGLWWALGHAKAVSQDWG